jgi:hypothetical protein
MATAAATTSCYTRPDMTTRATLIYTVATIWCAATAVNVLLTLLRGEPYVVAWWDAGVAGTGRKLGRVRAVIKLIVMIAVAATCALALAGVLETPVPMYILGGLIAVSAVSELSAPKPKRS